MLMNNNINEIYGNDIPDVLKIFCRNIKKNNPKLSHPYMHNLYLLQTTDRDGNITGEAYGMNLITNWGFKEIYTSGNSYGNYRIYIGNGTVFPLS